MSPGIGAVKGDYDTRRMPGWQKESLGYHMDDGKIYYNDSSAGRETKGSFRNSVHENCRI